MWRTFVRARSAAVELPAFQHVEEAFVVMR
jgi:hypothetical protein